MNFRNFRKLSQQLSQSQVIDTKAESATFATFAANKKRDAAGALSVKGESLLYFSAKVAKVEGAP